MDEEELSDADLEAMMVLTALAQVVEWRRIEGGETNVGYVEGVKYWCIRGPRAQGNLPFQLDNSGREATGHAELRIPYETEQQAMKEAEAITLRRKKNGLW